MEELKQELAIAGDETEWWEAKAGVLRPEHIQRSVAGLANRDGGLLLIGAVQAEDGWVLRGVQARPELEAGTWLADTLRALRPMPVIQQQIYNLDGARWAALLNIEPHPQYPIVLPSGLVLRREVGSTKPIDDGRELAELVFQRAGALSKKPFDPMDDPDALASAVASALRAGQAGELRPLLANLRGQARDAAEFNGWDTPDVEIDRLAAVAAVVISQEDAAISVLSVETHHELFDEALLLGRQPTAMPDIKLQREVRRSARTVGALLVRLRHWKPARQLAAHSSPESEGPRRGWLASVAANQARAISRPLSPEYWRHDVRVAAETIERIAALRPDDAKGNDPLNSILAFDFLCAVVDLDQRDSQVREASLWLDFPYFSAQAVRPLASKVLDDEIVRESLLPGRDRHYAAALLEQLDASARRTVTNSGFWEGLLDASRAEQVRQLLHN
ncbi:MAG TPA: hypothetical protein VLJ80_00160 [Solirubrobacteraceae bacterium]|nr:hypothetical protein [Solirubrobacteraceae bacterium]